MSIGPVAGSPFSYFGLAPTAGTGSSAATSPGSASSGMAQADALVSLQGNSTALAALGVPNTAGSFANAFFTASGNGQFALAQQAEGEARSAAAPASSKPGAASSAYSRAESSSEDGEESGEADSRSTPRVDTRA